MFLGSACFSNVRNKLKLISDNVEALTKEYESRTINGETCNVWSLGSKPTPESLQGQSANTVVPKVIFSTVSNNKQSFFSYTPQPGVWEELEKCDLDDYGWGWAGDSYCWLPVSKISSLTLYNTTTVKKLR